MPAESGFRHSGASGGPGNFQGTNYQIDYAILKTLELIDECLAAPHISFSITMERREISPGETAWDFSVNPADLLVESKLTPKKDDIRQWLGRVETRSQEGGASFQFVYSKGGGRLMLALTQVQRDAKESVDDKSFQDLANARGASDVVDLLRVLGPEARSILQKLELVPFPEVHLQEHLRDRASRLAGDSQQGAVREFLFQKLSRGAAARSTFYIRDIIDELRARDISLRPPLEYNPAYISERARETLVVLQVCKDPFPLAVMAGALGITKQDLEGDLSAIRGGGLLTETSTGDVSLSRPVPPLHIPNKAQVVSRALEEILNFIETNRVPQRVQAQVLNSVALAEECYLTRPDLVANVFRILDKLLKRRGDKHLVLNVAILSIDAARRTTRSPNIIKGEAQALICGQSWVYQRIGRLDDAELAAKKSLQLGQDIDWERNTAYCHKCIGRLCRMKAERLGESQRESLLRESISSLEEAISCFSEMDGFGPTHPEVGDCYSLLGRTYLIQQTFREAEQAIQKAYRLISLTDSKEYLDLLILLTAV